MDAKDRGGAALIPDLPAFLAKELNIGHGDKQTWSLVAQMELFGAEVAVVRLQLGNMRLPGAGEQTEIYRTPVAPAASRLAQRSGGDEAKDDVPGHR